jgi:hypothetical protein
MISFFRQEVFDTPQLTQFITRLPKFNAYEKALVTFPIGAFRSHFHGHLTERWSWELHAYSEIGSFPLWRSFAARPPLLFPQWDTSTSRRGLRDCIGNMTSRAANVCKFSIKFLP